MQIRAVARNCLFALLLSLSFGPVWADFDAACNCYRNIVWGPESWVEPALRKAMRQDLDFFPPPSPSGNAPLIVFAHPALRTKTILPDDALWSRVIEPARANGFAVASVEFRHPVDDDFIVPAPHDDLARATEWIVENAESFGVDRNNIFFLGHSRGTLLLWTALSYQDRWPFRINAFYGYNAQATYQGTQAGELFVIPEERDAFVAGWTKTHPQDPLFGSALSSIGAGALPLMLRYEQPFIGAPVPASRMNVHHPDFGLALCGRYAELQMAGTCSATDLVSGERAYDGYIEFFGRHLR